MVPPGIQMNERNAHAALLDLRQFLAESGASLQTIDAARLNELEAGYMREVRRFVPCARLIGVPRRVERKWLAFARLLRVPPRDRAARGAVPGLGLGARQRGARAGRHGGSRIVLRRAQVMKPFEVLFHAQWTA